MTSRAAVGAAQHGGRRGDEVADAVRRRARARRRPRRPAARGAARSPPPHEAILASGGASAWQIATASASASCEARRLGVEREQHLHHPLHLLLVGAAVAADRLLDARRRVLGALDARRAAATSTAPRACPTESAMRASAPTNDSSSATASGACSCDELADPVEDRPEPELRALSRAGRPAPVGECPEAPVAFVDDPVSARSRPWVDAEDLHGRGYGGRRSESAISARSRVRLAWARCRCSIATLLSGRGRRSAGARRRRART